MKIPMEMPIELQVSTVIILSTAEVSHMQGLKKPFENMPNTAPHLL